MDAKTVMGQSRKIPTGKRGLIATRRVARRVAIVDAYEFPSSVRQRLRLKHPALGAGSIALIEAATRQWFRLHVRFPRARLSMPARVVDDLWHEMLLHTRDYAAFCDKAFGRFLHHQPESAMPPRQVLANQSERLLATLLLAQADENCLPDTLPLLFRIDHEVGLDDARRYITNCGVGRGQCYDNSNPRLVCLTHLIGLGRLPGRSQPPAPYPSTTSWTGYGCGGNCAGGGCGGCGE